MPGKILISFNLYEYAKIILNKKDIKAKVGYFTTMIVKNARK
jgi:hypothetical protein